METRKVLIVLISKDRPQAASYESIIGQSYPDFSVLHHTLAPQLYHADPLVNKYLNCSMNRNVARNMALAHPADWFFFVDDDVVLPLDALSNLMIQKKDVVAGWYQMVHAPEFVAGKWDQEKKYFSHFKSPVSGLLEVDLVGLGCCLVSRRVLEEVSFESGVDINIAHTEHGQTYAGECLAFSIRCQKEGFKLYMNGAVVCSHINTEAKDVTDR